MQIESWAHENGFQWDHVQLDEAGRSWLAEQSLDRLVVAALTAEDTRPRVTAFEDGVVVVLRGVNLNDGAEVEDMISARLWCSEGRVISVWIRPLRAMAQLRASVDAGRGPAGPGELVSRLALGLSESAAPVVAELMERMDTFEDIMIDPEREPEQDDLSTLRRIVIKLRRYFAPQAVGLGEMVQLEAAWVEPRDLQRLQEARDRMTRITEELDALGARGQVIKDHLEAGRADHLNRQMYVLSVVAALFLPLGFVTGLLGINVGGMPGVENVSGFWIVCVLLVALGVLQWWVFRAYGIVGRTRKPRGDGGQSK